VNAHHSKKSQAIVAHKNPQGCLFAVAAIISAISLSGLSVILIAIHLW